MAKSVRLTPEQQARLERAAAAAGISVSGFIREAIDRHCDTILADSLADRIGDLVGVVSGGGGVARQTGRAFTDLIATRRRRRRR